MAEVLNEYLSWDFTEVRVRAMVSTTGKGDQLALPRLLRCVVRILAQRISRRPCAFVVHMSNGGSFVREGALAALARLCRFPMAIHLHGSEFVEFAARWPRLVRAVLGLAHKVYVLTAETEEIVRAALGPRARSRVVKVVNGVAVPETTSEKERIVLFAGEVGLRKGADVLLASWPAVHEKNPEWQLIVAGPVTPELGTGPAHPAVTIVGPVSRDQVHEWQARSSVVVLPSRNEALPMFLLESMARGCAVVATPVGEVEELVDGCGSVVPVGDADELALALNDIMQAPEQTARLGAASRAKVVKRYSDVAAVRLFEREWRILLESMRRGS
jgi:glycosyltransferase involved in cell wall biosynthesis